MANDPKKEQEERQRREREQQQRQAGQPQRQGQTGQHSDKDMGRRDNPSKPQR